MEQPTELTMLVDIIQTFGGLILLIVAVVMAAFTGAVAASKGHSGMMWGIGGLFFGLIALIAAAGLGEKRGLIIETNDQSGSTKRSTTKLNPYS